MLKDMTYVINMYCKIYFCTNNLWLLVSTVWVALPATNCGPQSWIVVKPLFWVHSYQKNLIVFLHAFIK